MSPQKKNRGKKSAPVRRSARNLKKREDNTELQNDVEAISENSIGSTQCCQGCEVGRQLIESNKEAINTLSSKLDEVLDALAKLAKEKQTAVSTIATQQVEVQSRPDEEVQTSSTAMSHEFLVRFPIESKMELLNFEQDLGRKDFFSLAVNKMRPSRHSTISKTLIYMQVSFLMGIGGNCESKMFNNVLNTFATKNLLSCFSLIGSKTKDPFINLKNIVALLHAVVRSKFPTYTSSMGKRVLKAALHNAVSQKNRKK